jgi:hydroxymethylbilane synthase
MIPVDNYREHAKELGQKLVALGGKELVKEAISQLSPKND